MRHTLPNLLFLILLIFQRTLVLGGRLSPSSFASTVLNIRLVRWYILKLKVRSATMIAQLPRRPGLPPAKLAMAALFITTALLLWSSLSRTTINRFQDFKFKATGPASSLLDAKNETLGVWPFLSPWHIDLIKELTEPSMLLVLSNIYSGAAGKNRQER